jgi:lipopolysaccharide/colanic/teichoic acid biosynthesis glycosyltransferase
MHKLKYLKSKTILYKNVIKPIADLITALVLLCVLSPIIILTMIPLTFANKGNIFFFQLRSGLNGKPFKIIKFKTMRDAYDEKGCSLPDKERLTKTGQLVRATSLDELLQLINVIKGDMSIVGPRPQLIKYLDLYTPEQNRRHEVKPGISGWAQVNGRNTISWEKKFTLDVFYVNNQCFSLDIKILWMTFLNVIQRKGISADGHVTIEEFKGNK